MKFEETYPLLWILFGAYFFAGVAAGLTDEEVLEDYRADASGEKITLAQAEMTSLLGAAVSDWLQAASEANRYFATLQENIDWLNMIKGALEVVG
jgi:hypothetical protein